MYIKMKKIFLKELLNKGMLLKQLKELVEVIKDFFEIK